MNVKTLAALSLVGMLLCSAAVWSLTKPLPPVAGPEVATGPSASPSSRPAAEFTAGRALLLEGRLGHAVLPTDREQESFVLASVRAPAGATASNARLNLAIVLDRSGSMRGKKLENAIAAARGMVDRLRTGDVVSLVAYNSGTSVVVPPTVIDAGARGRVFSAISGITAQGDTCISCGIDTALGLLREHSGMVDRLLLLSDGEATAGIKDEAGFRALATSLRERDIAVSSIGVDVEYNERVMAALAQESNGRHYFVETAAGLPAIFEQELQSLQASVALGTRLSLELSPGVEFVELLDRDFQREGNRIVVPLGSLAAGEEKTVLARVRIHGAAAGQRPLAELALDFRDLTADAPGACRGTLRAEFSADAARRSELDPLVAERLQRSETARTLTEANRLFRDGRVAEARQRLDAGRRKVASTKKDVSGRAPRSTSPALEAGLGRQERALDEASDGFGLGEPEFAQPPPGSAATGSVASRPAAKSNAPAGPSNRGSAQVRKNQEAAVDLAH